MCESMVMLFKLSLYYFVEFNTIETYFYIRTKNMIKVVKLQHFATTNNKASNIDFDSSQLIPAKSAESNRVKLNRHNNSPRHQYYDNTFVHNPNSNEKSINHNSGREQEKLYKEATSVELSREKSNLNDNDNSNSKKSSLNRSKSANEVTVTVKNHLNNLRLTNIEEKADTPVTPNTPNTPAAAASPAKRSILKKQNLKQKKIIEWAKKKTSETLSRAEAGSGNGQMNSRSALIGSNNGRQNRQSIDDDDFNKLIGEAAAAVITKSDIERNLRLKLFESELIDLSKARFKTLEMMDYQKRLFIERQLRKAKSLPGLLRCVLFFTFIIHQVYNYYYY